MKTSILLLFVCILSGCGEAFLDQKPNQTQQIPTSIIDYQAMMDYTTLLNTFSSHALGIIGSDESNMPDARYDAFASGTSSNFMKRAYTWDQLIYEGGELNTDWSRGYTRILQCNIVLDGLKKTSVAPGEQTAYNNTKGSALFYRAMSYYTLAQLFSKEYFPQTAASDLGLPLRLEADVTLKIDRATVAETYQQLVNDLNQAALLLPDLPKTFYSPSKAAAFGLLSRIYLHIEDYENALKCATQCLQINSNLIDFNSLNLSARYVFPADGEGNPEIIFMSSLANVTPVSTTNMNIDTWLLSSYTLNDLRKKAYFHNNPDGRVLLKGSYVGNPSFFTGIAVDEILLNRAECYARVGDIQNALADLNLLLRHRFEKSTFQPISGLNVEQVLQAIILERRKELVLRGTSWEDLKRLNKEPKFARTLIRKVKDKEFKLEPNSVRYVWPFPQEAIAAGGYIQNPR